MCVRILPQAGVWPATAWAPTGARGCGGLDGETRHVQAYEGPEIVATSASGANAHTRLRSGGRARMRRGQRHVVGAGRLHAPAPAVGHVASRASTGFFEDLPH